VFRDAPSRSFLVRGFYSYGDQTGFYRLAHEPVGGGWHKVYINVTLPGDGALYTVVVMSTNGLNYTWTPLSPSGRWRAAFCRIANYNASQINKPFLYLFTMSRLLTAVAVAALVLMLAAELHAQATPRDIPDSPPWMPQPPKIWPPTPPIRGPPIQPPQPPIQPPRPPIRPPIRPLPVVELRGYIEAYVVDPVDPMRYPGRTEYFFRTVDGRRYRLELGGAKFYLCDHFTSYVGTGKLVIVKGYLRSELVLQHKVKYFDHVLFATEVRDPAYPHCR